MLLSTTGLLGELRKKMSVLATAAAGRLASDDISSTVCVTLSNHCAAALLVTATTGRLASAAVTDAVLIEPSSQFSIAARLVATCISLAVTEVFC